jgi:hypothetical protein
MRLVRLAAVFGVVAAATAAGGGAAAASSGGTSGGTSPQAPAACTRATLTTFKFGPGTIVEATKKWADHYSNTSCVGSGQITGNLLYKGKTIATKTAKVTIEAS